MNHARTTPGPARGQQDQQQDQQQEQRPQRAAAIALLVSAQLVVMLDTSIVNVALPSVQADLGLSAHAVTWVVNAYVLTFGGLLLLLGRVGDLVGRRRMFGAGSVVFTAGTILAGAAGTEWGLLAGRVLQGAGAAALSPAAMALLVAASPGARRARAMSLWGAASAVGGATGVLAGGLLAGTFGWSSVFFVTVPVTAAAAVLAPRLLDPGPRSHSRRFDVAGAVTVTTAVVVLVQAALQGLDSGWTGTGTVAGLALSAVLLAAFVAVERRAVDPLVPLELFRSRTLSGGVGLALLGGSVRASTFVLVALYLQRGLDLSPQAAGLAMVPTSLTGFLANLVLLPRVLRAWGARRSLVAGLVVLAGGQLWLAWVPSTAGYAVAVLPGLLLVAVGVALSFTPTTMVITSAVPETHTGLASGLASSATQVGAALGTALLTTLALSGGGTFTGFSGAFTVAAAIAAGTALLGRTGER